MHLCSGSRLEGSTTWRPSPSAEIFPFSFARIARALIFPDWIDWIDRSTCKSATCISDVELGYNTPYHVSTPASPSPNDHLVTDASTPPGTSYQLRIGSSGRVSLRTPESQELWLFGTAGTQDSCVRGRKDCTDRKLRRGRGRISQGWGRFRPSEWVTVETL